MYHRAFEFPDIHVYADDQARQPKPKSEKTPYPTPSCSLGTQLLGREPWNLIMDPRMTSWAATICIPSQGFIQSCEETQCVRGNCHVSSWNGIGSGFGFDANGLEGSCDVSVLSSPFECHLLVRRGASARIFERAAQYFVAESFFLFSSFIPFLTIKTRSLGELLGRGRRTQFMTSFCTVRDTFV
ncbi:hypothetical protein BC938DRAFT_479442 [Jimgerdemannia flammicorona]|uniref:Uncharacterized protein n=1 Tax=Jimgerdemannia flammicorona TaxID=994334 RepID=A0A433QKU8_9FUNG|nr:hypothetical protein BC938DRAFT_479442 [Jimgerdemannia flammicorona]